MKFLVIDDSRTMRRIMCNALNEIGYEDVEEAEDGVDAVRRLKENAFVFVMSDWNMPNMSGRELTQTIRNHPTYQELPILMVTTRGM
jgi:two-component system chemotaxis response regulator CheY